MKDPLSGLPRAVGIRAVDGSVKVTDSAVRTIRGG